MTHDLTLVLDELADLVGNVTPDAFARPTPCPDYDVAGLRTHVLGWLPVFATALTDPAGSERPDPAAHQAPGDPAAAAAEVRDAAAQVEKALAGGVEDGPVRLLGGELPGRTVVDMLVAEVVAHGWDLARATGRPWQPSDALCARAHASMSGMLKPEYRGPDKPFGAEVTVPPDAPALDRLLAFSGRTPSWQPPA